MRRQYHLLDLLRQELDDPRVEQDIERGWKDYPKGFVAQLFQDQPPDGRTESESTALGAADRSEDAIANPHGNWGRNGKGNEGIRGLYSGVFIDGKSRAFVGGPQTLEIIDHHGQLLKRLPQQWGAVHLFQLVPRPDGTRDLLTARSPTAMIVVHVINSKTLDPNKTSFYSIPPEYDEVRSFCANGRHHLFPEGPDGDGKKEIIVGTASGMIVALDCQFRKLWARRLASPSIVL